MKKQDKLLEYISIKGSGEIKDFRDACVRLEIEKKWYEVLYNFCSLGHIDYFKQSEGWSCAETSLAVTSNKNKAVFCGARSSALKEELTRLADLKIFENNLNGPEIWKVRRKNGSFQELAEKIDNLNFTSKCAPKNLIRVLPPLSKYIERVKDERKSLPNSKKKPRWWNPNPRKRRWVKKGTVKRDGLWLIYDMFSNKPFFIQKENNSIFEVGDTHALKFALDQKPTDLLTYHPNKKEVSIETAGGGIKLPRLYSRVLTLCSGKLPKKGSSGTLIYADVPPYIAKAVFVKLRCGSAEGLS